MLAGGGASFADYELLEYLLALAIPRIDVKPIAKALISEFGGLPGVLAAHAPALQRVEGVGPSAAAALKFVEAAALRSARVAAERRVLIAGSEPLMAYLHAAHAHLAQEQVRVLFLDAKNQLIRDEVIAQGTVNQATVHVREVLRRAIELGAAALILVHNHPSGDPSPSGADVELTRDIAAAARLFEVEVHDHLIVGRKRPHQPTRGGADAVRGPVTAGPLVDLVAFGLDRRGLVATRASLGFLNGFVNTRLVADLDTQNLLCVTRLVLVHRLHLGGLAAVRTHVSRHLGFPTWSAHWQRPR